MKEYISKKLDAMGMGVGIACAIHCALFPVLFSSGFLASVSWLDHMWLDVLFLVASLYFAFNSLVKSYLNTHRNVFPILIALTGISIIGYILITHNHNQIFLPTLGGIFLAIAHFYNYKIQAGFEKA